MDSDVLIVGSGPAGISAAWAMLQSGLRVMMVDASTSGSERELSSKPFLTRRHTDPDQWKWMIGDDFHALTASPAGSPKLRVPAAESVFSGFVDESGLRGESVAVHGSLARGGLSRIWGAGVAVWSENELAAFPFPKEDLVGGYEASVRRMGVSGSAADDLADYFGVDAWAQPPIELDALHAELFSRYQRHRGRIPRRWRAGRSRVAALSRPLGDRHACDLAGNCMWGCGQKALYDGSDELAELLKSPGFSYRPGVLVKAIASDGGACRIDGIDRTRREEVHFSARRLVLAAGTLGSTALVVRALDLRTPLRLLCCPSAAFLLWLPRKLGAAPRAGFGLGQMSFVAELNSGVRAFGSTFALHGIAASEFVRHIPLQRPNAIAVMRQLAGSCVVGNFFLPGELSDLSVQLDHEGKLAVRGGHLQEVANRTAEAAAICRSAFRRLGALILPGSVTMGKPGADMHYAGTLPMRAIPKPGESGRFGEIAGLPGMHVVDGAALPSLSEKSHTLTIMANAHRIGQEIARQLCAA